MYAVRYRSPKPFACRVWALQSPGTLGEILALGKIYKI